MALLTATKDNFEEMIAQENAVVEFWAPWCGYCKRLAPVLKQVAKEHAEAFDILQINIDEFETLAEAYGIETIPTLALLHHGKAQDALIAPQSKHEVLAFLKEHKLIA